MTPLQTGLPGPRAGQSSIEEHPAPLRGLKRKPTLRTWDGPEGLRIVPLRESIENKRLKFDDAASDPLPSMEPERFAPCGVDEVPSSSDGETSGEIDDCIGAMQRCIEDGTELSKENWAENGAEAQNKDSHVAFLLAAWYGRTDRIEAIAEHRPVRTDEHWNASLIAVSRGHAEAVKMLVKIGGDPDMDGWGCNGTLLTEAAQRGYRDVVRVLLDAGAEIERENDDGETALDLARAGGHDGVVDDLEVESKNAEWQADLEEEHLNSLTDILEEKIRGNGLLNHKKPPKWLAPEVVACFLERQKERKAAGTFDPQILSEVLRRKGFLLIEGLASLCADGESTENTVHRDADILQTYLGGGRLVPEAVRAMRFRQEVVTEYLNRRSGGADVSPVHYARLIACGMPLSQKPAAIPIDVRDENGLTPLMMVAFAGHDDMIDGLLNAGADVNARAANGNTPLMFAAASGHVPAVRKLVLKASPQNAAAALQAAKANNRRETAAILEQTIANAQARHAQPPGNAAQILNEYSWLF